MPGATTSKGLGWSHQREREALLPYAYGMPCPMCQQVMVRGQKLDLDHPIPRVYGGQGGMGRIVHASCNRRAGQALAVARRTRSRVVTNSASPRSRNW